MLLESVADSSRIAYGLYLPGFFVAVGPTAAPSDFASSLMPTASPTFFPTLSTMAPTASPTGTSETSFVKGSLSATGVSDDLIEELGETALVQDVSWGLTCHAWWWRGLRCRARGLRKPRSEYHPLSTLIRSLRLDFSVALLNHGGQPFSDV